MDAGFLCDRAGLSWPKLPLPQPQSNPGGHEWPPYESEQGEQQITDGGISPSRHCAINCAATAGQKA